MEEQTKNRQKDEGPGPGVKIHLYAIRKPGQRVKTGAQILIIQKRRGAVVFSTSLLQLVTGAFLV